MPTPPDDRSEKQSDNSARTRGLRPYPPGVSGNPGGRPKGRSLTARLLKLVEQAELGKLKCPEGKDIGDMLMETAVKQALLGDFRFWDKIMERVDGKIGTPEPDDDDSTADPKEAVARRLDSLRGARDEGGVPGGPEPG